METLSSTWVAGFVAMFPWTFTRPSAINSTACSRERAKFRRTNSASSLRRGTTTLSVLVECEHRILQGAMNLGEYSWVIAHWQLVKVTQFSDGCINTRVPCLHIERK